MQHITITILKWSNAMICLVSIFGLGSNLV